MDGDVKSSTRALEALFAPSSVAVMGALGDPGKLGWQVLRNIVESGYAGDVYPVSRSASIVAGRATSPDLAALAGKVDLAFLMVPAPVVPEALEQAAAAGVKVCIVGASGFAESGDHVGQARQAEIARRTGMRIVGPNCNGVYNTHLPLSVGFNRAHGRRLRPGGVALLSHSGALFDPLNQLLNRYGSGLSYFVSAGNEVDLTILDYAEYALEDANTRVLALLIDALADGPRFARLARRAEAVGKAIVVLKLGATHEGAQAAVAHSSRMTGSAQAYEAFFQGLGVPVVRTLEGLMAAAAFLDRYGRQSGGLATVTSSGAGGALVADLAVSTRIPLATYTPETAQTLQPFCVFSSLANPTDLGVFGTPAHWDQILPAIAADPNVGVLMCYAHAFGGATGEALRDALALARAQTGKPVFVVAPGGFDPEDTAAYAARDIPVIADTVAGLEAAGALLKAPGAARPKPEGGPRIGPWPSRPLTEAESLQALSAWGLPVVPYKVAADRAAAVAAAEALGWPVAVKAMTAGVAHKSDHGLVRLNLADAAALDAAAAAFAGAPMIVQAMARGDLEAIIGVSRAAGVGMVLMLGLGGVYAESLGAVCIWPIDAAREALEAGLDASVLGRILQSPRWPHAAVRGQLLEALAAVQAFARAAGEQLDALDVNPLILGANGVIAVDALVMPRGAVQ